MMNLGRKRWITAKYDKTRAAQIAEDFGIDAFTALLMVSRGISDNDSVKSFLNNDAPFQSPFDLIDMDKAVRRMQQAIESFERIAVYGDYDADGVTATALLYSYLEAQGADVIFYIPERDEGYGLHPESLDKLKELGTKLVVTVDNGITAVDEAEYAKQIGLELVITDHHRPSDKIPDAQAVVDAFRSGCKSEFKDWSGVGIAFKLISALENDDSGALLEYYADIIAVGTIADVVPLLGENRRIVKYGLELLNNNSRVGLDALRTAAGIGEKQITSGTVAFMLAPRINAAGRMGSAKLAVQLLLTEDADEAESIANEINSVNKERQRLETEIFQEAEKQLKDNPERLYDRVIIVNGEKWHQGVIGIVAARLVEKYGKPSIVISFDGDMAKGSGRSVNGFSLFDLLSGVSEYLVRFGGHTLAAGLTVRTENIEKFREAVNEYAALLDEEIPFPELLLDCKLKPNYISVKMVNAINKLEPFGACNEKPVFGLFNMYIKKIFPVGGGKHLRISFEKDSAEITAMKFGTTKDEFPFEEGNTVDLAVRIEENEFRGEKSVSINIRDIRLSGINQDKMQSEIRIYEKYKRGEELGNNELENITPTRETFADVYRFLRHNNGWKFDLDMLYCRLSGKNINYCSMAIAIDAMEELGLIIRNDSSIEMPAKENRVNLKDSKILSDLRKH